MTHLAALQNLGSSRCPFEGGILTAIEWRDLKMFLRWNNHPRMMVDGRGKRDKGMTEQPGVAVRHVIRRHVLP